MQLILESLTPELRDEVVGAVRRAIEGYGAVSMTMDLDVTQVDDNSGIWKYKEGDGMDIHIRLAKRNQP